MRDRWYQAALDWVNEIRASYGVRPLEALEPGKRFEAGWCPISRSLEKDNDEAVAASTVPYFHNDFGSTSFSGKTSVYWLSKRGDAGRRTYDLPMDVSHFVKRFDRGYYEELDAGNYDRNYEE